MVCVVFPYSVLFLLPMSYFLLCYSLGNVTTYSPSIAKCFFFFGGGHCDLMYTKLVVVHESS